MAATAVNLREGRASDRPQLIKLWGEIFGDDDIIAGRLLECFAGPGNIFIVEKDEEIIAQLLAVPCIAGEKKGAYFYALATEPKYRGRGVMTKLMEYSEKRISENGGLFAILIPASLSLFKYYDSHGFETVSMLNMTVKSSAEKTVKSSAEKTDKFQVGVIPVDIFLELRKKYIDKDVVTFSKERTLLELEEQWYYGCESVFSESGYALFIKIDDTLFITEIGASDSETAQSIIAYAQHYCKASNVKITLPSESNLCLDSVCDIKQTPQAQYKWWGEGPEPEFYIRFALDDLPLRIKTNREDAFICPAPSFTVI